MRGAKPKPTHLKVIEGNPGKRALNHNEPKPEPPTDGTIPAPPHLSRAAKRLWPGQIKILRQMRVLTVADLKAVEGLCEAIADFRTACRATQQNEMFYTTYNSRGEKLIRVHPMMALKTEADRRMRVWLNELGMTPSARSRIEVNGPPEEVDPANRFFATG